MNKEQKNFLSDNRGFSLVEIMVVIAIMAIIVGVVALSYNTVSNANVSAAAKTLNSEFSTARSICMAKGAEAGTLTLKVFDGKLYSYIGSPADGASATQSQMKKISNGAMTVKVSNVANAYTGTDPAVMSQYSFESSGALTGGSADTCIAYLFMNKHRGSKVVFYPETGKHDVYIWNF